MKKFIEITKKPFVVACIATILYLIDALIAPLFVEGATFMWVGFAFWAMFFGAGFKERIKALIGAIIGFFAALLMILITSSFSLSLGNVSVSCLIGVFVVNFAVVFFEKAGKVWLDSVSGIFVGIMLTFSGFGLGLNPLASFREGGIMLLILIVYAILGLACGYFTLLFTKTKNKKVEESFKENSSNIQK